MQSQGTIFLVDDNPGMLIALSGLLEAAGYAVETFPSAHDFLRRAPPTEGCLILDIHMPRMTGLELQERLISQSNTLPIIVLTGRASLMEAVRAVQLGSFDVIEKPYETFHLLAKVQAALNWDRNQRAKRLALQNIRRKIESLSERERQVLALVVAGSPSKTIADTCGIAVSTVDNHRARIMKKLGADSMAEMIRLALIAGA